MILEARLACEDGVVCCHDCRNYSEKEHPALNGTPAQRAGCQLGFKPLAFRTKCYYFCAHDTSRAC